MRQRDAFDVFLRGQLAAEIVDHLPRQLVKQIGLAVIVDLRVIHQVLDQIVFDSGLFRPFECSRQFALRLIAQVADQQAVRDWLQPNVGHAA